MVICVSINKLKQYIKFYFVTFNFIIKLSYVYDRRALLLVEVYFHVF